MSEPERKSFLGSLPEALFIAMLTVDAYWLSFRYEAGYLSAFGSSTIPGRGQLIDHPSGCLCVVGRCMDCDLDRKFYPPALARASSNSE
jgi:hypothetical protein